MKTNTTLLTRVICLALVAVMAFGLCACPAGTPNTGTTGTTTTTGGNANGGNPGDVTDATYADGAAVEGAGATIPEGSTALITRNPDTANAKEVSTVASIFRGKAEDNATYNVAEASTISASGRPYEGNGAILVVPNGIVIDGAHDFALRNMTIIGPVTVKNSDGISFESVEIRNPNGAALTIEENVTGITVQGCRIEGATAMKTAADNTVVVESAFTCTVAGIADTSKTGTVVMNCTFTGEGTALSTTSSEAYIRQNTFTMGATATAIEVTGSPLNVLVALNDITGAQKSMVFTGATNISVILNRAITVVANNNHAIYICDNSLGGRLRSEGNNYFLADGNAFPEGDGLDHSSLQANNQNTNGDTITDIDSRPEAGVNEDLLPHTDKDLFVGMEKKEYVVDGNVNTGKRVNEYIQETAKNSPYVIIAPGLYRVMADTFLNAAHSNTTVYGYGAQMERVYSTSMSLGRMFAFSAQAHNITLKGLTIGFERQSCGQVYVLDKYVKAGNKVLLVVTGAGMDNEFGNTDSALYNVTGMGAQRMGTFFAYCDTGFNSIKKLDNGLMEMTVSNSVYDMILEGDILTCRSQQAGTTLTVNDSTDITFQDMVIYGNSGGFASVEGNNRTATTYYRLHNTTKSGPIIDEATYNWYKSMEDEYGVSTEVYIDELGRYRGSLPHIGSIDATHTTGCAQGSVVVSCIFENMCDDATNQNHTHARVDELIDNGDGTTTIVYKGNYSRYSYEQYGTGAGGYCRDFVVGDRVYVYTSAGQLVCDTAALSVTQKYMINENGKMVQKSVFCEEKYNRYVSKPGNTASKNSFYTNFYFVTVKTEDVNFDAVEGFDMTLNTHNDANKVLIDNMSMASNGFIFDNVLSQNIRSRGLLIKASEGQIINCTFNNIGMACAAILYEIYWGESGVSENLYVARNVMNHTGYFTKYTSGNQDRYSPIAIEGLGSRVDEDYLLYKNIQIVDNVILNRTTKYAVYINSARDILIKGNDFGDREGGEDPNNPTLAIHINGAMNIEISGNKYSSLDLPIEEKIIAEHNKNVFGSDVEWEGASIIPDND